MKKTPLRTKSVQVKLTAAQLKEIKSIAKKMELSASTYLLKAGLIAGQKNLKAWQKEAKKIQIRERGRRAA